MFPILCGKYHVSKGKYLHRNPVPNTLGPPFVSAYDTLASDIGTPLGYNAKMNPDIGNGLILTPKYIVVLYAAVHRMNIMNAL